MTSAVRVGAGVPVTAEQLGELPENGCRHELVGGELRIMAPAGGRHGQVALTISRLVGNYVHEHRLGRCYAAETGFVLSRGPDTVRAPDLAFVSGARISGEASPGFLEEVPDLVVEVISPSDRASDVTEKALAWLDHGVRLVWVIDPRARLVTVHRPGDVVDLVRGWQTILDGGEVLPGFGVSLDDLFA